MIQYTWWVIVVLTAFRVAMAPTYVGKSYQLTAGFMGARVAERLLLLWWLWAIREYLW